VGDPSAVGGSHPVELLLSAHLFLFLQVEAIPVARRLRAGFPRRVRPATPEGDGARAEDQARDKGQTRGQPTAQGASDALATARGRGGLGP
jgi:hypothetical protein